MRSLIMLFSTAALAACNLSAGAQESGGTGEKSQRSYDVGAFDGVSLGGSHDVVVTVGGAHSVRAEGDAAILDRLDIRSDNGTLKIGTQKGVNWTSDFMRNRAPVTVYVTVPRLALASVAGSGDMKVDRIEGDRFKGAVAGSGDLQIGAARVENAEFSIAGSGGMRTAGAAARMSASIAGSGSMDLTSLETKQASVSVAGSGNLRARASDTANVSMTGSGNVTVAGTAKCSVTKRGSGSVRCGA